MQNIGSGGDKLAALQDSFAEVMDDLGLERGLRGSDAHHEPVRRFYGTLRDGEIRAADRLEQIRPDELRTEDELHRYARLLEVVLEELEVQLALETRKRDLRFEDELRKRTGLHFASDGTYIGRIISLARGYCIQAVEGVGHVLHSLKRFGGDTWREYLRELHRDRESAAFTYDGKRANVIEAWFWKRHYSADAVPEVIQNERSGDQAL